MVIRGREAVHSEQVEDLPNRCNGKASGGFSKEQILHFILSHNPQANTMPVAGAPTIT